MESIESLSTKGCIRRILYRATFPSHVQLCDGWLDVTLIDNDVRSVNGLLHRKYNA